VRVHDSAYLTASKRLYMTATPRLYDEASKVKAGQADAVIASMDDVATFGPEFHRLGFGQAVTAGLLTDYKVLVLTIDEGAVARTFQDDLAMNAELNLPDVARIVGCWNALAKRMAVSADGSALVRDRPGADAQGGGVRGEHQGVEAVRRDLRADLGHVPRRPAGGRLRSP
jgi:predicted helicase